MEQGQWYISMHGKSIALHRHIYQQTTGTTLTRNQVVHHIDGNPLNNDPSNLMALTVSEHMRLHRLKDKLVRWSPEEDARLLTLHKSGMTIHECSLLLERPYSGTRARLNKLKKRNDNDDDKTRH